MNSSKLKTLREQRGLSLEDIASAVSVSRQTVLNWEDGKSEPKISQFIKLCKVLKCSQKELLGGK